MCIYVVRRAASDIGVIGRIGSSEAGDCSQPGEQVRSACWCALAFHNFLRCKQLGDGGRERGEEVGDLCRRPGVGSVQKVRKKK